MSEGSPEDLGEDTERASSPSGMQVWLACVLFVLVPTLLILILKYVLDV